MVRYIGAMCLLATVGILVIFALAGFPWDKEKITLPVLGEVPLVLVTGLIGVFLILISLTTKAHALSTWPNTPVMDVVAIWAVAAAILVFGNFITSSPTTCGGEVMGAGDRCIDLDTGDTISRESMEGALINQPWVYWLIALVVAGVGMWALLRRRGPTQAELDSYLVAVAQRRKRLSAKASERFDRQVRAELRRASRLRRPKDGPDLKALLATVSKAQPNSAQTNPS